MPCFIKNNLFDFLLYLCQIAENFNENYPVCEKIFSYELEHPGDAHGYGQKCSTVQSHPALLIRSSFATWAWDIVLYCKSVHG